MTGAAVDRFGHQPVTRGQFELVVRRLLQNISFQPPQLVEDPSLELFTSQHLLEAGVACGLDQDGATKLAKIAAVSTLLVFPLHDKEVQKVLSLFNGYFFLIDDFGHGFLDELKNFRQNLLLRKPQGPILDGLVQLLIQMDEHYGSFCADAMISSTLNFITAFVIESHIDGELHICSSAPNFPFFFRFQTGLGDAYARMIFPNRIFPESIHLQHYLQTIPDLSCFACIVNDVLSFYKESIISKERNNYIYHYAMAQGISPYEALAATADKVVECITNIKVSLSSQPNLWRFVDVFIRGAIALHGLPRYRLSECDLPTLLTMP